MDADDVLATICITILSAVVAIAFVVLLDNALNPHRVTTYTCRQTGTDPIVYTCP